MLYKTFYKDAIILRYLFGYTLEDDIIIFDNSLYDKIIIYLKENNINFCLVNINYILLMFNDCINKYNVLK